MHRSIVTVLLLAASPVPVLAAGAAATADHAAFDDAIARVRAGDASVDLYELRMLAAQQPGFTGSDWDAAGDASQALQAKRYEAALKLAEARLKHDELDARAHMVADAALKGLGRPDEAAAHERLVRGLLDSILAHGDGKSAATAWTAIGVAEEYDLLGYLGLTTKLQALRTVDGHNYDVMTVTDAAGNSSDVWFGIDLFFGKEFGDLFAK